MAGQWLATDFLILYSSKIKNKFFVEFTFEVQRLGKYLKRVEEPKVFSWGGIEGPLEAHDIRRRGGGEIDCTQEESARDPGVPRDNTLVY